VPKTGKAKYPGFVAVAPAGVGKPREDFVEGRLNNISRDAAICLYMSVYDHDLGQPASQGGGMGIVLAGLNEHITAANVNIPALCDHLAFLNVVSAPKQIVCDPDVGHGVSAKLTAALTPWVREHLGLED
jgi:hypothetical protein